MSESLTPMPAASEQFNYELLSSHKRSDGTWKTGEQLRMEYLQLTDGLIHKMVNGIEVTDPATGETRHEVPDVVVWLDKSARPLAWLTKELWPTMSADPATGKIPPMPKFNFVNIDREQWINTVDPEGTGVMNIGYVDKSVIRSLRSVFVAPKDKTDGLTGAIDEAPASLDNKTIMIVDEVYSSGRTLQYAKKFFQKAFPTAHIGDSYWMRGIARRGEATGNKDLPVWYKEDSEFGRGVGNRNDKKSSESKSMTQRLGRYFLSTPLREADPKSQQLRRELHELASNPDVPVRPASSRTISDQKERLSFYNGGLPVHAVMRRVNEIKKQR